MNRARFYLIVTCVVGGSLGIGFDSSLMVLAFGFLFVGVMAYRPDRQHVKSEIQYVQHVHSPLMDHDAVYRATKKLIEEGKDGYKGD